MRISTKPKTRNHWFAIIVALVVTSCGPQDKIVTIKGTTYYFPANHVHGFLSPEENSQGEHYIRLKPVSEHFLLTYDPLAAASRNEQGPHVPTIRHINFAPGGKIDVFGTGPEAIVCLRTISDLSYTCGMRVSDSRLDWVMMFDRDLLASATALKANAEKVLLGYRTDGRLRT